MSHVDEGTLHALLDGELDTSTLHEVQTHFATCPACAARLAEAKQLIAETERLVNALEVPAGPRSGSGPAPDPWPAPGVATPPPLDPVVLIPDNPTPAEIRRSRLKVLAWAAALVLVAGTSFAVLRSGRTGAPSLEQLRIRPEEFTSTPPSPGAARAGQAAPAPAESGVAGAGGRTLAAAPATATPAPAPAPGGAQPPAGEERGADRREAADRRAQPPPEQPPAARAAPAPKRPAPAPAEPKAAGAAGGAGPGGGDTGVREDTGGAAADRDVIAARAAAATAALDRERERARDAAAMARLDSVDQARRRALQAAESAAARPEGRAPGPAPAAPPTPSPEQRAGVTGRIGLDEATRQLGGPLHAIDAASVTRQFVGLAPGSGVPGADATRPVVRAVYVDRVGRRLYLDQQRVRPGQAAGLSATPETGPGGAQRWVAGSVLLVLHGELPPDSLRELAQRVR